ncbi:MAG: polymer-forming cytoskeletal protein [Desulfobacterales bacterium]
MKTPRSKTKPVSTYLGEGVSISGTVAFKDTIRLDGRVKGKIISDSGTVIIGEKAVVNADITADVVIVMGEVHGTINAKERIEAYPPAQISGDIKAPVIAVEPGVVFNGNLAMEARQTSQKTPAIGRKVSGDSGKEKPAEKITKNL